MTVQGDEWQCVGVQRGSFSGTQPSVQNIPRQKTWTDLLGPFREDAFVTGDGMIIYRNQGGRLTCIWSFRGQNADGTWPTNAEAYADAQRAFDTWKKEK